ncbi:MAG: CapA family protein [candidate division KSB1 bacterium]|nr:CapA family protein [candidate division KSB1 bacterium]MDZ7367270.1 CapA family protein [candidate division KSB1 bacterium]MDZ7405891.1 CapA family protein [candidate division KSB1 bacterium]
MKRRYFFLGLAFLIGCASQKQSVAPLPPIAPLLALQIEPASLALLSPAKLETPAPAAFSLVAVGDVMLGSWVVARLDGSGSAYPFEATKHILRAADFAIANLEAPFTDRGEQVKDKKFTFRVPPRHARGLKESGFDILHLANNHILDFGPEGLFDTMATLDSLSLLYVGAGENIAAAFAPVIVERENVNNEKLRFGFLGFSMTHPEEFYAGKNKPGTAFPFWERYLAALDSLAPKVDIMIVSFHWGAEKMVTPKAYQIDMAHAAIDRGADIVIGHHPHVLQGLELYRSRPTARQGLIAYSLGNFAFGSYSPSSRTSIILKCVVDADGVLYARCFPINVFNDEVEFQPQLLQGQAATAVIDSLNALSRHLNFGQNIISAEGIIVPLNGDPAAAAKADEPPDLSTKY